MPLLTTLQASTLLKAIGSYTVRDLVEDANLRGAVLALFSDLPTVDIKQWHRDVVDQCLSQNAVNAIKIIRAETGFGLKEAKDIHDNLREALAQRGRVPASSYMPHALSSDQKEVFDKLIAAVR